MTYELAIFDFDGTLADSAEWMGSVFNDVAKRFGYRTISRTEMDMLRGRTNREIIRYLGVPAWKIPLIARHMRDLIARDAGEIRLFDGVDGCLRRLSAHGVRLAIVSSNAEANVRRILGPDNAARISCFECGASLFGKAAKFRRVVKRSGVAPHRTICIGDEARDIEAAARAGLASGAVTWGYAKPELLQSLCPTLMFGSLEDVVARLGPPV